jgi:hypothetical protein
MNKVFVFLLLSIFSVQSFGQKFEGGWVRYHTEELEDVKTVMIVADNYLVATTYTLKGRYIGLSIQKWTQNDLIIDLEIVFDSDFPESTGERKQIELEFWADRMTFKGSSTRIWTRIDEVSTKELPGTWQIKQRTVGGVPEVMDPNSTRKTLKMLSDTRFQWVEYDTQKGELYGTAAGTYTAIDGKYIENVEMYSRDISKVGVSSGFDYVQVNGEWSYSGQSVEGTEIREVLRK